ncbi:MAG TPA: hypothetical protein VMS22_25490, partial [Candidatus Eisenbacteria bacterium]|nr:hypothetical protein [Candidatus Eisenbacteria bacterium]
MEPRTPAPRARDRRLLAPLGRRLALAILAIVLSLGSASAATTTIPGTPMTIVLLDTQGGRHQVRWNGVRQIYPNSDTAADSGITLFFNGTSYGFSGNATGGVVGANTFGVSSQTGLLGTGTLADPWRVTTVLTGGATVTVTQTVYYVQGDGFATVKWVVLSTANYPGARLFHAVDSFPQGQDRGYGAFNAACSSVSVSSPQVGPNFFSEWTPITPASAYREVLYSTGWNAVRAGTLNNTVDATWHDAFMALQWTFDLAAGVPTTIYQKMAFGSSACSTPNTPPAYLSPPTVAVAASATPNPATGTTTALSVLGADNLAESTLTYTWAVTSGPSGVAFNQNGTNAAKNATATFTQAGTYTFQVTITDQDALTVTSSVVVVVQQTASTVTVSPASAAIDPHATQAFSGSLRDQFGNAMASQPPAYNWMVSGGGSIDATGVFTAGGNGGGPFTVTATDPGSSASGTAAVTIANDAPTISVAASATPNPATGTSTALSVLGADDGGESHLTYTWAVTAGPAAVGFSPNGTNAAKSSTATFAQAGTYTLQATVTDEDGLTVTSSVVVVVSQTATSVTVAPASATVDPNATQAFGATVFDQFGAALAVQPAVTWMVSGGGSIDAAGVFTAGGNGGGPFTVTATASGHSGTASVTIANDAPTIA